MRKKPLFLTLIVLATALSASAQTSSGTPPIANSHGMSWNASDWNLPPAVIRYLKKHPRIAKKVLAYYHEHGEWPPFPPNFPGNIAAPSGQVQMAANVQWPAAPPPPPAAPVAAGSR